MVVWTMLPCDKASPPEAREMAGVEQALAAVQSHLAPSRYALKDRVDLAALSAHSGNQYAQVEVIPDVEFERLRQLKGVMPIVLLPAGAGTASVVGTDAVVAFQDMHGSLKGLPFNERATLLCKAAGMTRVLRGDVFIGRLTHAESSGSVGLGEEVAPQFVTERSWLEAAQTYHKSAHKGCVLQDLLETKLKDVLREHVTASVKASSAKESGKAKTATESVSAQQTPSLATSESPAEAAAQEISASGIMSWKDGQNEVTVRFEKLPGVTKAKHVRISIKEEFISVEIEDSKDGCRTLIITLEKSKAMRWLMLVRNDTRDVL
ncbi:MAG: hypothetical protein SGPRY_000492 [Prymnesium sp.]